MEEERGDAVWCAVFREADCAAVGERGCLVFELGVEVFVERSGLDSCSCGLYGVDSGEDWEWWRSDGAEGAAGC